MKESPSAHSRTRSGRSSIRSWASQSVVELALTCGIEIEGGTVRITMTLTAPSCPIHDVMADWVRQAVLGVRGVEQVDVTLTFDPPWTPARIEAR